MKIAYSFFDNWHFIKIAYSYQENKPEIIPTMLHRYLRVHWMNAGYKLSELILFQNCKL
jgi:hypothetical protein